MEENLNAFVKNELRKIQKVLSSDYIKSQAEELLQGDHEMERKSSSEAFLRITANFLRIMKEEVLAQRLENSKRISLKI